MPSIKVQKFQTLFDIAMQHMGDASYAMDIAVLNNLSITADLSTGDQLDLPEIELTAQQEAIVKKYAKQGNVPAGMLPA